jgi:hypothetical protein
MLNAGNASDLTSRVSTCDELSRASDAATWSRLSETRKTLSEAGTTMKPSDRTQHDHHTNNLGGTNDDERSEVEDDSDEIDPDDAHWDAFLADEDELDPQPEPGDFWPET